MLTAVVSGSTSFKFQSFKGASGGGPGLSGLVVHSSTVSVSSTNDSRTIGEREAGIHGAPKLLYKMLQFKKNRSLFFCLSAIFG